MGDTLLRGPHCLVQGLLSGPRGGQSEPSPGIIDAKASNGEFRLMQQVVMLGKVKLDGILSLVERVVWEPNLHAQKAKGQGDSPGSVYVPGSN